MNKKAIGPVVAVSLLLTLAVISVIGFQSFLNTYQSGIQKDVESDSTLDIKIDNLIQNRLYILNSGNNEATYSEIKINNYSCSKLSGNLQTSMNNIGLGECSTLLKSGENEITLVTNKGVISKKFYSKNTINLSPGATLLWSDIIDSENGNDIGSGLYLDSSNNLYVSGYYHDGIDENLYFAKYDNDGNQLWNETLISNGGRDLGSDIELDSSNNIYITGYLRNGANYDFYLTKYDSNRNHVWNETIDFGTGQDLGIDIELDSSNNIYIVGYIHNGADYDIYLTKYDSNGNDLWNKTINSGTGHDVGVGLFLDINNNLYVSGYLDNGVDADIYLTKYDSNGNNIWNMTHDLGSGTDVAYDIELDLNNNIYIAGYTHNGADYDIYMGKYDSNGSILWNETIASGTGTDVGFGIDLDAKNNIYITGYVHNGVDSDLYFSKYDTNGNQIWNETINSAYGVDIELDLNNNIYITGYTHNGANYDFYLAKFQQD